MLKAPPPLPKTLSPEFFSKNPMAVVAFVEAKPERLDPKTMTPELVITLARVLVRGDRPFLAEKLLGEATTLWPKGLLVGLAHARVLRRLGQPHAALRCLEALVKFAPDAAEIYFLRAGALLEVDNTDPVRLKAARDALGKTLALEPGYQDAEGDDANSVRYQLKQIDLRLQKAR